MVLVINPSKNFLITVFFSLALILSFTLITIIPNYFYYFFLVGSVFIGSVCLVLKGLNLDKKLVLFLIFFLMPSALGLIGCMAGFIFESDVFSYERLNPFGRLFNLFILLLFIVILHAFQKQTQPLKTFRWYKFGVFLLLITAIWQAVSVYTGLIPFPFETRSHLHSARGVEFDFGTRITGIAQEPSYFTMFAIDFFALALLLHVGIRRCLYVALAFFLLVLSLSPSGYITFAMAFIGACFFTSLKFIRLKSAISLNIIVVIIIFIVGVAGLYYALIKYSFADYIFVRVTDPSIFQSARAYMNYMPFVWAGDSNIVSVLFGHGIKSYSIISSAFNLPSGEPVHATSNNIYVDIFWESGLVGLVLLLSFFGYILFRILKSDYSKLQIFIALFVLFDLTFSGIFRADYASLRFFILLYLLFILINYDVFSRVRNSD